MKYYPRQIETPLQEAARRFRVVVLTGARQTGKSTTLERLFRKTHRTVSLDNPRDLKLAQEDPRLFFEENPPPVILDEIQYAPGLLTHVKLFVDRNPQKGLFIITGSQQFAMMKNLRETLAGRAVLFHLLPLSLGEGKKSSRNYAYRSLNGSYPELVASPRPDAERWFGSYLATYLERDVQPHYQLEKITHFRDFIFLLATRTSQILNYQSLSNDLGVSISAIKLWVKILEASGILYLLRPYYINLGSRLVKSPKVYFTDTGFANYLMGNTEKRSLFKGPQAGPLFENFVIQECLKHFLNQGRPAPLYYYRTNNGLEVDLLIEEKRGRVRPCEIKLTRTPHAGMVGPLERLQKLNRNKISLLPGALISLSAESFALTRQVRAFSVDDFLKEI